MPCVHLNGSSSQQQLVGLWASYDDQEQFQCNCYVNDSIRKLIGPYVYGLFHKMKKQYPYSLAYTVNKRARVIYGNIQ